jgi:hypothetical protein
MDGDDKIL